MKSLNYFVLFVFWLAASNANADMCSASINCANGSTASCSRQSGGNPGDLGCEVAGASCATNAFCTNLSTTNATCSLQAVRLSDMKVLGSTNISYICCINGSAVQTEMSGICP